MNLEKQKILNRHYSREYQKRLYRTNKENGMVNVRKQVSPLIKELILQLIKSMKDVSHETTIFQIENPNQTK